mgnify:CR=1 FL=1
MITLLYDSIFIIFAIIYLPIFLVKRKFHQGFRQRLGFLPVYNPKQAPIWVHMVSVGEAIMMRPFVAQLRKDYPDRPLVLSTVTVTGNKIAKHMAKDGDLVCYLPLDISFIVRRFLRKINPALIILAETELWPNLITAAECKKIPVVIVNGRISDGSFGGYRMVRFLLKPLLSKVNLFCMQTDLDKERLEILGVMPKKTKVTKSMKFDATLPQIDTAHIKSLKDKLHILDSEKIFIAASTHQGEEEIILAVYKELLAEFSDLRLVIVPRHPERAPEVSNLITKLGFSVVRISQLNPLTRQPANPPTVFILDTVGELINYYAIADIVFMGGSFVRSGGHNILEPALLKKPIVFGPHMFNFRSISDMFLKKEAAILLHNEQELKEKLRNLLSDKAFADRMGAIAYKIIEDNRGATKLTLIYLKEVF